MANNPEDNVPNLPKEKVKRSDRLGSAASVDSAGSSESAETADSSESLTRSDSIESNPLPEGMSAETTFTTSDETNPSILDLGPLTETTNGLDESDLKLLAEYVNNPRKIENQIDEQVKELSKESVSLILETSKQQASMEEITRLHEKIQNETKTKIEKLDRIRDNFDDRLRLYKTQFETATTLENINAIIENIEDIQEKLYDQSKEKGVNHFNINPVTLKKKLRTLEKVKAIAEQSKYIPSPLRKAAKKVEKMAGKLHHEVGDLAQGVFASLQQFTVVKKEKLKKLEAEIKILQEQLVKEKSLRDPLTEAKIKVYDEIIRYGNDKIKIKFERNKKIAEQSYSAASILSIAGNAISNIAKHIPVINAYANAIELTFNGAYYLSLTSHYATKSKGNEDEQLIKNHLRDLRRSAVVETSLGATGVLSLLAGTLYTVLAPAGALALGPVLLFGGSAVIIGSNIASVFRANQELKHAEAMLKKEVEIYLEKLPETESKPKPTPEAFIAELRKKLDNHELIAEGDNETKKQLQRVLQCEYKVREFQNQRRSKIGNIFTATGVTLGAGLLAFGGLILTGPVGWVVLAGLTIIPAVVSVASRLKETAYNSRALAISKQFEKEEIETAAKDLGLDVSLFSTPSQSQRSSIDEGPNKSALERFKERAEGKVEAMQKIQGRWIHPTETPLAKSHSQNRDSLLESSEPSESKPEAEDALDSRVSPRAPAVSIAEEDQEHPEQEKHELEGQQEQQGQIVQQERYNKPLPVPPSKTR